MESAAETRHSPHSKAFRWPRNVKSRKCDESGMGRDESGKPIGHLAKAGRIETNQGVSQATSVAFHRTLTPHPKAVSHVDHA